MVLQLRKIFIRRRGETAMEPLFLSIVLRSWLRERTHARVCGLQSVAL